MDRPQAEGMERVSLITLLQEDKKTQKDRHKRKKETKERERESETVDHDHYLFTVSTENVVKMQYKQNKQNCIEVKKSLLVSVCVLCPNNTSVIGSNQCWGVCVCWL